ncbi:IS3 family transposase [Rothia nasimurium]|uniref:IS3 family transposase n=1 Tax=Rothia nasimurium TaxID=85336 RepID=UPI003C6E5FD8
MYHGESFASVEDFCQVVDDYIYWYNNGRLQERLEGLAPMWYRSQALAALTV